MIQRKNQNALSSAEWDDLIDALDRTHGVPAAAPRYRDFVKVHSRAMNPTDMVGMSWGVHTMGTMMRGRNFLSWHRRFVFRLEARLRKVHPDVTIPYWNALVDRAIPTRLADPQFVGRWGIQRNWKASLLAPAKDLKVLKGFSSFDSFQSAIEGAVHASVHNAVGGDMASGSSPADPLFFLHHANIDRLWAEWQTQHKTARPSNLDERLKPSPLFGVKVRTQLKIKTLGYEYV